MKNKLEQIKKNIEEIKNFPMEEVNPESPIMRYGYKYKEGITIHTATDWGHLLKDIEQAILEAKKEAIDECAKEVHAEIDAIKKQPFMIGKFTRELSLGDVLRRLFKLKLRILKGGQETSTINN